MFSSSSGESLSACFPSIFRKVSTPFLFLFVPSRSFVSSFPTSPPPSLHPLIFSPSPAPAVGHSWPGALQKVHGASLLPQRPRRALRVRRDVSVQLQQPDVLGGGVQAELARPPGPQVSGSLTFASVTSNRIELKSFPQFNESLFLEPSFTT